MTIFLYIIITLSVFISMEAITWLMHKYVMHGFLWYLHKDHHEPKYTNPFEKNDWFFVIFATPSILLFYFGTREEINYLFFIGLGIFLYGLAYFFVHDIFIHSRFKILQKTNTLYFKALRRGHKMHHKHLGKYESECFGMLMVPVKHFQHFKK